MRLLILTTAINRSELHKETFEGYKKLLTKGMKVRWIINIDTVEQLEEDGIVTELNIIEMFDDYPNVHFEFIRNRDGNFNRAVRRLLVEGSKYLNKTDFILWLEDDWLHDGPTIPINEIISGFQTTIDLRLKYCVTSISKGLPYAQFMEMSPRIWSKPMFKVFRTVFDWNDDMTGSPELIAQSGFEYVLKKLNTGRQRTFKMQYPLVKDVGRDWMESKGLKKGNKRRHNHSIKMYK